MSEVTLRLDSKNRISLTKLLKFPDTNSVRASLTKEGNILLKPMASIPAREMWLYKDKKALDSVRKGLSQKGTIDRGSFAKYVEDDNEI